jgi:tetratricopeptide (TPR) repeat protein
MLEVIKADGGNVKARVVARLFEIALVVPAMENWVRSLMPGDPFCNQWQLPDSANGIGLVEAARGALGHWLRIERGKAGYLAVNLNPKNFTLLNGKQISSATVRDGDILSIGDTTLALMLREDARPLHQKPRTHARALLFGAGALLILALTGAAFKLLQRPPAQHEQAVVAHETRKQQEMERTNQQQALTEQLAAGNRLLGQGNCPAASDRFRAVLKIDASNAEARAALSRCDKQLAEENNARLTAQQRAMELQQQIAPLLTEATVRLSTKDFAGAKQHLLQAKGLAPDNPDVIALLARVETELAREQAKKLQLEAERNARIQNASKTYREALELKQAGKNAQALQTYERALDQAPDAPEAGQAKQDAQELRAKLAEQTAPAMKKAEDLTKKGKPLEALAIWRDVLAVYPQHPEAMRRVAALAPQLQEKANVAYQEGLAYEDLGQINKAVDKWKEAVFLLNNPEHDTAKKAEKKLKEYNAL